MRGARCRCSRTRTSGASQDGWLHRAVPCSVGGWRGEMTGGEGAGGGTHGARGFTSASSSTSRVIQIQGRQRTMLHSIRLPYHVTITGSRRMVA